MHNIYPSPSLDVSNDSLFGVRVLAHVAGYRVLIKLLCQWTLQALINLTKDYLTISVIFSWIVINVHFFLLRIQHLLFELHQNRVRLWIAGIFLHIFQTF